MTLNQTPDTQGKAAKGPVVLCILDGWGHREEIENNASELSKRVALTILADLVDKTPVDTSKALSNWQVGIGSPVSGEIEAYYPGEGGNTAGGSSRAAYEVGKIMLRKK